jgi:hypothetical protein
MQILKAYHFKIAFEYSEMKTVVKGKFKQDKKSVQLKNIHPCFKEDI